METSNVVLYETLHYTICMYVVYVWPCFRLTVELVQKAEHAGVSWISVHGRTVQQRTEPVSLEAIKLVCVCVCMCVCERAYSFFTYINVSVHVFVVLCMHICSSVHTNLAQCKYSYTFFYLR